MPFFKKSRLNKSSTNALSTSISFTPQNFDKVDPDTLLSTSEIISRAQKGGADFGPGNPLERIRYFIKLGLLPYATRKLPNYPTPQLPNHPVGHLPAWTVARLIEIGQLNAKGLTFPQIAEKFKTGPPPNQSPLLSNNTPANPITTTSPQAASPHIAETSHVVVQIASQQTEKQLDKKLVRHEESLKKFIESKFKEQAQVTAQITGQKVGITQNKTLAIPTSAVIVVLTFSLLTGSVFIASQKLGSPFLSQDQKKRDETKTGIEKSALVLAATSDRHQLYVDANMEVAGTSLFEENITAPNVVYTVSAGTGIAVTGDQNPVVSLDSTAVITSVNDLTGAVTLKASGSASIAQSGSTITISSSSASEADTLSSVTGRGASTSTALTLNGTVTFGANATVGSATATTASGTGDLFVSDDLEFDGRLIAGTSAGTSGDCLVSAGASTAPAWGTCSGSFSFTLTGSDSGTNQTISNGDTLTIAAGTGIDTTPSAGDILTVTFNSTEIAATTWGSGSSFAWTFNSGTTDPVLTFGDNTLTIGSAATVTATDITAFNCTDCLDFDDIADSPTLDATTDINLSTLDLYVDLTSSGVFSIRDVSTAFWTFDDDSTVDIVFPAAGTIGIDASTTANTITSAGVLDLNVTSATSDNRGIDLAYTANQTSGTGYGIYGALTHSNASGTSTAYGQYLTITDATALANTNFGVASNITLTGNAAKTGYTFYGNISSSSTTADSLYGGYFTTSATGNAARTTNYGSISYGTTSSTTGDTVYGAYNATVSTGAINGTTRTLVGTYGISTATGATNNTSTISNVYGAIFSAVGENAGASMTGNTYGLFVNASTGDNVYGLYFGSTNVTTDIVLQNGETIDNDSNDTVNIGTTTLLLTGGTTLRSSQTSVDLFNTTTTTLNIAGAATTVNLGNGSSAATIGIGTGNGGNTLNIATGTGQDTINIGTGATNADVINIGTGSISQTTNPIQSVNPTLVEAAGSQTLGLRFKPKVNGRITQLGMKCDQTSTYTVRLWRASDQTSLGSVSVTNDGTWKYTSLSTPIDVQAGVLYTVTSFNASSSCTENPFFPSTDPGSAGNIIFDAWLQSNLGLPETYPTIAGVSFDGGVDITFVATSSQTNLASTTWTLSAEGNLRIDATTAANTTTDGVIDIDNTTSTTQNTSLKVDTTITSSTGHTNYGIYANTYSSTAVTTSGQTIIEYGAYINSSRVAADTQSTVTFGRVYGVYSLASYTTATTGRRLAFGGVFSATSDTLATLNETYGIFINASQGDNNYGLYIAATSSNASADNLYGAYSATSATGNAAHTGNYGSVSYGSTTSTTADNVYAIYAATSSSGAVTTGTKQNYGIYSISTSTNTNGGSSNIYGGIFNAVGENAGSGTGTAYGIYVTASGGDTTNYALYVTGTNSDTAYFNGVDTWVNMNGTNTTNVLCASTDYDSGTDAEVQIVPCTTDAVDYAEFFPTASDVDYGHVVVVGTKVVNPVPGANRPLPDTELVKSTAPYQNNVIGVASNNYSELNTTGEHRFADENHPLPIALSGRVPVKVIDEGGPIAPGDLLTTSSTPGYAMRADPKKGTTFAKAIASFDGPGTGEILAFIQLDNRPDIRTQYADLNLNAQSFSTTSGATQIDALGNIATAGNIISQGTLEAAGGLFTVDTLGNITAQSLTIDGNASISGTLSANSVIAGNISAPPGSDLNISLGDNIGSNSLKILDVIGNVLVKIDSQGNVNLNGDGVALSLSKGYICVNDSGTCNIQNPQNGTIYADAFVTNSTADLAENFATTDNTIEAGDLVSVDSVNAENVIKSKTAYDSTLLGVISTAPGISLNTSVVAGKPLALAGRVPVKVNSENGPIKAGDPITSSSTPGIGMRATQAGRVIGIALESAGFEKSEALNSNSETNSDVQNSQCNNVAISQCNNVTTIIVFVNPSWYYGDENALAAANESLTGNTNSTDLPTYRLTDSTKSDGTLASSSQSTVDSRQLSEDEIRSLVADEVSRQVGELLASSQLSVPGQQVQAPVPESTNSASINNEPSTTNQSQASGSALSSIASATEDAIAEGQQIIDQTQATLDKLTELLHSTDLSLSTLTLTGQANLASTQVAGTFSQDGTFIIDYGKQLNVLGSTLYLQNDPFAGDETAILVDVGNGNFTFDKLGNLTVRGQLLAESIQTKELTIDSSNPNYMTVGTGQIENGKTSVTVFTTAIKPNAKILITPQGPTGGKNLYVQNKTGFKGFTVSLDSPTSVGTIKFDWLIINTKEISQAN